MTLPAFLRPACVVLVLATLACAGLQRPRINSDDQWAAEARAFDSDSSRHFDEKSLYRATFLFGTPGRPMYNPAKARELLVEFKQRFPGSSHRDDISDRLMLLEDIVLTQQGALAREREIEAQLETVTAEARLLRDRLDSASVQGDQTRKSMSKLESDLREREEQLRALRLELQRLKEIDLKPRRPPR